MEEKITKYVYKNLKALNISQENWVKQNSIILEKIN